MDAKNETVNEVRTEKPKKKPSQHKRRTEMRRKAFEEQRKNPDIYVPIPVGRHRRKGKKVTVDDKNPESTKISQEKEFYTIEEALDILSTPPKEVAPPVVKSPEVDLDILDLRTSPVQVSPPHLAFYRVGEQNHPNVKSILSPTKIGSPSSRWKISRKSKFNDMRITIRRDNPQSRDTPVKQRVFKEWRKTVDIANLEDPDKKKRPRPPTKEPSRKRRRSPARSEKKNSKAIRSPCRKKTSRCSRNHSKSPKKIVKRDKLHSPRPTLPHARPSTYRTPKRPKLGLENLGIRRARPSTAVQSRNQSRKAVKKM
ncbi:peptidyl-prolyl cis-trans isomerase CYP95-like [Leptopilina heterotoma]|uniref:peptidyl-prolyl cis-trans isomerase CYP95-like n=1 Tax=Leptopilina heterotoma TaxID=63436 RepID=UPI001CA8D426|nr:peptidyl-prolyl cis-trans isomerase CYP95-like [Leptopilina heterotoma]